VTSCSAVVGY